MTKKLRSVEVIKTELMDLVREFTAATELEIDIRLHGMDKPLDQIQYLLLDIRMYPSTWHGGDAPVLNMVEDIRREVCTLKLSHI